jgi:putative Mg2+ transporter-C (MgtC) family protein
MPVPRGIFLRRARPGAEQDRGSFVSAAMDQIIADLFPRTEVPYPVMFARMVGAILLGAVIGAEREYRAHPAGLRTHILVALSACVFSLLSIESVHMAGFADEQVQIDPLRVIEAVTSGVAFLAAGMIVFSRGEVRGLTTGAGMWLAGAVGLSVGLGYWFIATVATFACFAVLMILGKIAIGPQGDEEKSKPVATGKDER